MSSDHLQGSLNRRSFMGRSAAAGLAFGLGASGCGPSSNDAAKPQGESGNQKPYAGQTLRVFTYAGAWEKAFRAAFVDRFQQETGATVIVNPGWWDSIPNLKASPPGQPAYDLVLIDATQGYPAIREGLFQTIAMDRIPNMERLAAGVLDNWVVQDGYGITFPDSAMTIAYNRTLLDQEPAGWGDFLKPDLAGKVGLYDSFYMSVFTFACMKVAEEGRPGEANAEVAKNLDGVLAFAKEHREMVKIWWKTSSLMTQDLINKNAAIANMHSPDVLTEAMRGQKELGTVVPQAYRAFVLLMWVIPAGTQRKALAEEAINLLLSDEVQVAYAEQGLATANASAARQVAETDAVWASIYPSTAEQLKDAHYYPYDAYFERWDEIVQLWDREILRRS